MTKATGTTPLRRAGPALLLGALVGTVLAACSGGPGSGTPRPTDPRIILTDAVTATAALPSLRLHGEVVASMGALPGRPNQVMTGAVDADIDLTTRQFAARATSSVPANPGAKGGAAQQQVSDTIVTQAATFNRDSRTGRWSKFPSGGIGGPTNAQVAAAIIALAANPATTFELKDAAPCTLGTCDHVIVHLDGTSLAAAIGQLAGGPANGVGVIPNIDLDVLVDQATSVISEVRTSISMGGASEQLLLTVSNPGQPVQIAPPPPALTDDFGANFGGGGIGPDETILDQVGSELESTAPDGPEPSTP
jgi:hypothetical protein